MFSTEKCTCEILILTKNLVEYKTEVSAMLTIKDIKQLMASYCLSISSDSPMISGEIFDNNRHVYKQEKIVTTSILKNK
jgi:hypothetical protein